MNTKELLGKHPLGENDLKKALNNELLVFSPIRKPAQTFWRHCIWMQKLERTRGFLLKIKVGVGVWLGLIVLQVVNSLNSLTFPKTGRKQSIWNCPDSKTVPIYGNHRFKYFRVNLNVIIFSITHLHFYFCHISVCFPLRMLHWSRH